MERTRALLIKGILLCAGCGGRTAPVANIPTPPPAPQAPSHLKLVEGEWYPGQRTLAEKVEAGNLRGGVKILDFTVDDPEKSWHAQGVKDIVVSAGVPEARVSVQGDTRSHIDGVLNVPGDTRVIVLPIFPAYDSGDGAALAKHNLFAVASAGNIKPDESGNYDRDLYRGPDHPRWGGKELGQGYAERVYWDAMNSLRAANGKAVLATWVDIRNGEAMPVQGSAMCGDAAQWCFAVRLPEDMVGLRGVEGTSQAASILGVHAFYLSQLWGTAEEVFGVLKQCAVDVGEPGVDREFGLGVPSAVCDIVQRREADRRSSSPSRQALSPSPAAGE